MDETRGDSPDQLLAENLRRLREDREMSQSTLATAMHARGVPWHQQTVGRIEAGQQQVRFAEATVLAAVLGVSLDRFTWTGPEANESAFVYAAGTRVRLSHEETAAAICRLLADIAAAGRVLASSKDSKWPRVQEALADTAERVEQYSLDDAIAEGVRRYGELTAEPEEGE